MVAIVNGKSLISISGDWVDVSGAAVKISGESVFVYISGGNLQVDISGDAVTVSGNWVNVSGATVIAKVSGEVVQVSGQAVNVSGATVIAKVSGETVVTSVSGNVLTVLVSGGIVRTVSGNVVNISGYPVNVSGATVIAKVSGEVVQVSGQAVNISGATVITTPVLTALVQASTGSGAIAETLTNDATIRYFDYAEYHATSGTTTSSELTVAHNTVKIYSLNMAVNTARDLIFMPDLPLVLISGDIVVLTFSNPNACAYSTRLLARL